MRSFLAFALVGMLALAAPATATLGDYELGIHSWDSIYDFISNKNGTGVLGEVLEFALSAGLLEEYVEALQSSNFTATVFAPVDEAFVGIDLASLQAAPEKLEEILKYHIVPDQALTLGDIKEMNGGKLQTLLDAPSGELGIKYVGTLKAALLTTSGQEVPIYQYNSKAGGAIVHTVKEVLVPGNSPIGVAAAPM